MEYYFWSGMGTTFPISKREFETAHEACIGLQKCMAIEEKYDMVVENFIELETSFLSLAIKETVTSEIDSQAFQEVRVLVDRRVLNFLSSGRLYINQMKNDVPKLLANSPEAKNRLADIIESVRASSSGFRIMNELRNYVQHRGLSAHNVSFEHSWLNDRKKLRLRFSASILIEHLREDQRFNKDVLEELTMKGEKVELLPILREYMEALSLIQHDVRQYISSKVTLWDRIYQESSSRYLENCPDTGLLGLEYVAENDEGITEGRFVFPKSFSKLRKRLENKNGRLEGFRRRYVSSEAGVTLDTSNL